VQAGASPQSKQSMVMEVEHLEREMVQGDRLAVRFVPAGGFVAAKRPGGKLRVAGELEVPWSNRDLAYVEKVGWVWWFHKGKQGVVAEGTMGRCTGEGGGRGVAQILPTGWRINSPQKRWHLSIHDRSKFWAGSPCFVVTLLAQLAVPPVPLTVCCLPCFSPACFHPWCLQPPHSFAGCHSHP
jgi:hypothetical protein